MQMEIWIRIESWSFLMHFLITICYFGFLFGVFDHCLGLGTRGPREPGYNEILSLDPRSAANQAYSSSQLENHKTTGMLFFFQHRTRVNLS